MRPALSIVIPTLNEENYLPHLLEDLLNQTRKDFEVIVVDAKSKDNTRQVAESYNNKLTIAFIESSKGHVAHQRNLGAEKSKSAYIFFIDADTRIDPDVVEKIMAHISKDKNLLYLPVIQYIGESSLHKALVLGTSLSVKLLQKLGRPLSMGPIIVISKALFHKIGGFNETIAIAEDHNLIIKAHKEGVKAKFIEDAHCYFSMRRFESEGTWPIVWQYIRYTGITLVRGGVNKSITQYEQGGQKYQKTP